MGDLLLHPRHLRERGLVRASHEAIAAANERAQDEVGIPSHQADRFCAAGRVLVHLALLVERAAGMEKRGNRAIADEGIELFDGEGLLDQVSFLERDMVLLEERFGPLALRAGGFGVELYSLGMLPSLSGAGRRRDIWIGRHEDENGEPRTGEVLHPVVDLRRRQNGVARTQGSVLVADTELAFAFEDEVATLSAPAWACGFCDCPGSRQ